MAFGGEDDDWRDDGAFEATAQGRMQGGAMAMQRTNSAAVVAITDSMQLAAVAQAVRGNWRVEMEQSREGLVPSR